MLRNLAKQVKEQMNIELKYTETLKSALAKESYDKKYGARPLRRMIQNKIEDNLAEEILGQKKLSREIKLQCHIRTNP